MNGFVLSHHPLVKFLFNVEQFFTVAPLVLIGSRDEDGVLDLRDPRARLTFPPSRAFAVTSDDSFALELELRAEPMPGSKCSIPCSMAHSMGR